MSGIQPPGRLQPRQERRQMAGVRAINLKSLLTPWLLLGLLPAVIVGSYYWLSG